MGIIAAFSIQLVLIRIEKIRPGKLPPRMCQFIDCKGGQHIVVIQKRQELPLSQFSRRRRIARNASVMP